MEIRIGIQNSAREITFETNISQAQAQEQLRNAYTNDEPFILFTDKKDREYLVPLANLAYVELGAEPARKAGFVS